MNKLNAEARALLVSGLLLENAQLEASNAPLFTCAPLSAGELESLISAQLDAFAVELSA